MLLVFSRECCQYCHFSQCGEINNVVVVIATYVYISYDDPWNLNIYIQLDGMDDLAC